MGNPINVTYDSGNGLQVDTDTLEIDASTTIYWAIGTGVNTITGIDIHGTDAGTPWPYDTPSATDPNSSSWSVLDQDTEAATSTYKYTISAYCTDSEYHTLDPRIEDDAHG